MNILYKLILSWSLVLLFCAMPSLINAQSTVSKYQALYTIRFLKYINWNTTQKQYLIGVVGSNSQMLPELIAATKDRLVNGKPVSVQKVISYAGLDAYSVIFIPNTQTGKFYKIRNLLKGKDVLIVTEAPHLAKQGADISFYVAKSKLKFNLNKANIYARNMTVSARLLSVATVL